MFTSATPTQPTRDRQPTSTTLELAPDVRRATRRLSELRQSYRLPAGAELQQRFLRRVRIGKLELFMAGLVARGRAGQDVFGAAAGVHGYPIDRAFFELLERLSIFGAREASESLAVRDRSGKLRGKRTASQVFAGDANPARVRRALSNGVALRGSWREACAAALCELIERDRVLRSFAGEFAPQRIALHDRTLCAALARDYAVEAYRVDPPGGASRHSVAGVFLFPLRRTAPLSYGFAASSDRTSALASATREALQRLAFLWGEALPSRAPKPAPTPDYHQAYYLYPPHHQQLRAWLAGNARRKAYTPSPFDGKAAVFIDLTPAELRGQTAIAKASARSARVLSFGLPSNADANSIPHPIA